MKLMDWLRTRLNKQQPEPPTPIGHIECYCGEQIPMHADLELWTDDDGEQRMAAKLDSSQLWLHSFTKHPDAYKEG